MGREHKLYRARGPADAFLLQAFLDKHGVASRVEGLMRSGLAGQIPVPDAQPVLLVAQEDRAEGEALLERWNASMALVHPEWVCTACGESSGPNFEICWSCETPRDP